MKNGDKKLSNLLNTHRDLTHGRILAEAINHFHSRHPQQTPIYTVALEAGVSRKKLERAIRDLQPLTSRDFERILKQCEYVRDGYFMLAVCASRDLIK